MEAAIVLWEQAVRRPVRRRPVVTEKAHIAGRGSMHVYGMGGEEGEGIVEKLHCVGQHACRGK